MEQEIWKDIEGYEGLYQVSNTAVVRSLEVTFKWVCAEYNLIKFSKRKGGILKQTIDFEGYCQITLCKPNGHQSSRKVHRLVAQCFIPNPQKKPYINHKNGIKHDNRIENLEWCTHMENSIHAKENGLLKVFYGKEHHSYGKKSKGNKRLILDTSTGIFYDTSREASAARGVPLSTLRKKMTGVSKNNTSFIYV